MKYFRYKNIGKNYNNALKEQYLSLTKDEKRIVRQGKFWERLCFIVTYVIFAFIVGSFIFLLKRIPNPSNQWLEALAIVGKVIAGIVLSIASVFLTYVITVPLRRMLEKFNIPLMKKEIFSKACQHLRDYYELQEPYILTKCYDSSNENFKDHDVCIFIVNDELRITTDLIRGFLHGDRDLGCYAFKKDEISISKKSENNRLIAELKSGDTFFLLGYRAKSFIEKKFVFDAASAK